MASRHHLQRIVFADEQFYLAEALHKTPSTRCVYNCCCDLLAVEVAVPIIVDRDDVTSRYSWLVFDLDLYHGL